MCRFLSMQWEESLRVFRRMEAGGVSPDVMAHNAAITACAKVGGCRG